VLHGQPWLFTAHLEVASVDEATCLAHTSMPAFVGQPVSGLLPVERLPLRT
jgi:hypothetical protein